MKKKVIVTGAGGFVGGWLCKKLLEEAEVIACIKNNGESTGLENLGIKEKVVIEELDIGNKEKVKELFRKHKAEECFHLAAIAVNSDCKSPKMFDDINVRGTENVLEACIESGTEKVLLASTIKVYGKQDKQETGTDEEAPLHGKSNYSLSKIKAEEKAREYAEKGLNVFSVRCSNIYGENDLNFSRLVPGKIKEILNNKNPVVHGNGETEIDLVHVNDVVNAYLLAMQNADKLKAQAINVCSGKAMKVKEVVDLLIEISGKQLETEFDEKKEDSSKARFSNEKARELLGWKPKENLEEKLKEAYAWYARYLKK